jgi:hypothetical protein
MNTKKNNVILIIFAIILFILSSILPSYSSKDFMIYYQVEHNSYSNNIKLSSIVDYYITKDSIITIIKSTTDNYTARALIKEKDGNIYYYFIDDQNKSYSEISKDFLENRYSFNNNLLDETDSNMTEELSKLYMEYLEEQMKELNDINFKEHFKNKEYHPYCSCGHCSTCIENCSICKNSAVRKYDKKMKELQEKYKDKYSDKDKDKYSDKDKDKPKESDKYSDKDKDKYSDKDKDKYSNKDKDKYSNKDKDKPKESDKYSDKDKDKYSDKDKDKPKESDKYSDKDKDKYSDKDKDKYSNKDKDKYSDKDKDKPKESDKYSDKDKDKYSDKDKDKYSNKDKDKYSDKDKDKPKESDKYSDKDKDKYSDKDKDKYSDKDKDKPKESDKYSDKDKDKYSDKDKDKYSNKDKDKYSNKDKDKPKESDKYSDKDKDKYSDKDKVEAKKTADNKIIDKYKCEKYDFNYKGKKVAELYLTKYKNLVKPEYTDLYKDIMNSDVYNKLLEISECYELYYKSNFLNILKENIVIKSNFYKDDKLVYEGNLKDFKIVNKDPKLFEIPKDYMKIDYKDLYKK